MTQIREGHHKKGGVGDPPSSPKPKITPGSRGKQDLYHIVETLGNYFNVDQKTLVLCASEIMENLTSPKDEELKEKIRERIQHYRDDERLSYPPATVFANAPLALLQAGSMQTLNELEDLIGEPRSSLPIENR